METFWEKLKNWLKKASIPKEGIDYEFFDFPETDLTGIKLLRGKYADVIYYYKGASFSDSEGYPKMSFSFELYQTGKLSQDDLLNDEKFDIIVGDILVELMVNNETIADGIEKSDSV